MPNKLLEPIQLKNAYNINMPKKKEPTSLRQAPLPPQFGVIGSFNNG